MADLTAIEQEIIEATKFKMKRFANRQDYLAAIARAMEKMPGDDYDNLSDDATDWYEEAAKAVNSNDDIPDFPEEDESETDDAADEADDDEAEEAADDEADDEADEGDDTEEAEDSEDDEESSDEETEPEPKAKKPVKTAKGKGKKKEPAPEAEPEGPKGTTPAIIAKMKAKKDAAEAKHARKQGSKRNLPKTRYDDLTGEKNRYGYIKGTKVDDFCTMIEKGASMAEVKAALGDTYYNTIKKLREEGHSVEKNDAGKFILKHKDDAAGKKAKK